MQPPQMMPRTFRRVTGAHAIIAQLVLADLLGAVIWMLIGGLIAPPIWYGVRAFLHLFHASLLLDLWLILVVVSTAIGLFRQHTLRMEAEDAWGAVNLIMVLSGAAMAVIWLVHSPWISLPAESIPAVPVEPISWKLVLVPQGVVIAACLWLLVHLLVARSAYSDPDNKQLTLSRAHPDGPIWQLVEQAYALYRKDLARFNPSPIGHLKTPATFSYYQRQTAPETPLSAHPDHELFWRDGILIINRSYIGPRKEQAEILLPLLARMLYDYNTPNRLVEHLFHLAHVAEHSCLATVFLAIPLIAAQRCERQWQRLERERVLERDWFAYACGQGPGLRKQVRLQLQERTDNDLPDNTIPTLAERIDHLDSLLGREERQVERLREMLSAPPAFPPTQSVG